MLNPIELMLIDRTGYNGIDGRHIDKVAKTLPATGQNVIDRADFERACRKNGIDPGNFSQSDLDALERRLNE